MLRVTNNLGILLCIVLFAVDPLQAGIVITDRPDVFSPSVQAQARRGRTGWESKLATPNLSDELDPRGAPFWNPSEYYEFSLGFNGENGTVDWWIDVDRDQQRSSGESLLLSDSALVGRTFNFVNLNLTGRERFSERAMVRDLVINGQSIGATFDSQFGVADHYFTESSQIDWAQVQVSGELRLTWDTSTNRGSQERPRVWLTLGNGSNAIPEPAVVAILFPFLVYLSSRRQPRPCGC